MNAMTEVELIARQHISERIRQEPRLPRQRRRTRVAGTLRRVADRLDG
jgi:hypothetical protein